MTSPWPRTTLGELFEIGAGKSVTPRARVGEPRHPFLRTSNVLWGRLALTDVDAMHFTPGEIQTKSLRRGDLLVCEGGAIGRAALWDGSLAECSFQNHLHRLRPRTSEVEPRFFMYYLQAGFTLLGIYEGAGNKTTIPNLSRSRLAALEVPRPGRAEQTTIAALLWKMQHALDVEEKVLCVLREHLASTVSQLFTHGLHDEPRRETEIGPLPGSWRVAPLAELAAFKPGRTPARARPEYWATGDHEVGTPWVAIADMVAHRQVLQTRERITATALDDVFHGRRSSRGTLVMSFKLTIGRVATLGVDAVHNEAIVSIRPTAAIHQKYLEYFLGQIDYAAYQDRAVKGNTLNMEKLARISIAVPPLAEQTEMAAIFEKLEQDIEIHEHKQAILRELFETLLHDLMTGAIRVTDLDLDTSNVCPTTLN